MTYREAVEKAYGMPYISCTPLEQAIIEADRGQNPYCDAERIYFYFSPNDSSGANAMIICAEKYGGIRQIQNLLEEDGSVNYQIWLPKNAPAEIIQFVCAIQCNGALYPMILGIPIHELARYLYRRTALNSNNGKFHGIDETTLQNAVEYIQKRFGLVTREQMIDLLVSYYGASIISGHCYWIYHRSLGLVCDKLPFSVAKIIDTSQMNKKQNVDIKWKSEYELYKLVLSYYSDAVFHYSTAWLGEQHIDIYIPSIMLGIEYQGKQHFEAVEFFGG